MDQQAEQILDNLRRREYAMNELRDRFDIREFHNVVLTEGSIRLDLLEDLVQEYVDNR